MDKDSLHIEIIQSAVWIVEVHVGVRSQLGLLSSSV